MTGLQALIALKVYDRRCTCGLHSKRSHRLLPYKGLVPHSDPAQTLTIYCAARMPTRTLTTQAFPRINNTCSNHVGKFLEARGVYDSIFGAF